LREGVMEPNENYTASCRIFLDSTREERIKRRQLEESLFSFNSDSESPADVRSNPAGGNENQGLNFWGLRGICRCMAVAANFDCASLSLLSASVSARESVKEVRSTSVAE
jgi:hypothetical protein